MSTNTLEGESYLPFDSIFFNDQIDRIIEISLPQFKRKTKEYVYFNLFFFCLFLAEVVFISVNITPLVESSLLALSLALVFLTLFSYFSFKLYLQNKKPRQLQQISDQYVEQCRELIGFRNDIPEHRMAVANACLKLSAGLEGQEHLYYQLPGWLDFLGTTMDWFSCYWHWWDVHRMRELMLEAAIEEHIELVKLEPTDLAVHASLANAYVLLSNLYLNPHRNEAVEEERWYLAEKYQKYLKKKFRVTAERAIEEFKILSHYAPDDPWVHLQLAYSYHDLGMPDKETKEYETLLKLCPDDPDILYKLGTLYFQQGLNAKGLQIYEGLKDCNYKKAQQVISRYGDFVAKI